MHSLNHFFRMFHISYVLSKHGLDEIILATHLFRSIRFLAWFSLARWNGRRQQPRGIRIRLALEELGPIFIKFGQILSTRYDVLPEDIIQELSKLQDQVPPFPGIQAKQFIEAALQKPLSDIFRDFETTPLASASIAQVHAAVLLDDRSVVVKVLRPNIHALIKRDVELLQSIAKLANRYWKAAKTFKPLDIVAEFQHVLYNELDLIREAANASQLKRDFSTSKILHVPTIYWEYSRHNVLVMEHVYGTPISNFELLKQKGFDLKIVAHQLIDIFFIQVFRNSFFHADMHPGNILVADGNPQDLCFNLLDFGIMGTLSPHDQHYLAENLWALLQRDYRRVAELHVESGWIPKTTRMDQFEAGIRAVCESILEKPLSEVSFGQLLFRLFQLAREHQINIQPQLILLQKTLVNIEGLSRALDPTIDLFNTGKPF